MENLYSTQIINHSWWVKGVYLNMVVFEMCRISGECIEERSYFMRACVFDASNNVYSQIVDSQEMPPWEKAVDWISTKLSDMAALAKILGRSGV